MPQYILTLTCPDQPGIVRALADGIVEVKGNILENAQFSDPVTGTFCVRTQFESPDDGPRRPADDDRCGTGDLRAVADAARRRRAQARAAHGVEVRPLPRRPALPVGERRAAGRHPARGVEPQGRPSAGRAARHPVRPPARHEGRHRADVEGGRRSAAVRARRRARGRPRRPGPVHAGAVGRRVPSAVRAGDQHPPLVPARASRAPSRTTRPTSAA